jgi:hypothetical protein
MNLILNIGLAPKPFIDLSPGHVLTVCRHNGLDTGYRGVYESSTEPALVMSATLPRGYELHACINQIANALGQDCIAVYDTDTDVGQLIGPRAAAWGDFNPEFFLMLDGAPLAESLVTA